MGPVVSEAQLASNLAYVALAQSEGGELATGGHRLEKTEKGYYMAPTVFLNTDRRMRVNREEMFGPITCVLSVADLDEAIEVANDTPYGLTAGIATTARPGKQAPPGFAFGLRHGQSADRRHRLSRTVRGTRASSYGPREQDAPRWNSTQMKTSYIYAGPAP